MVENVNPFIPLIQPKELLPLTRSLKRQILRAISDEGLRIVLKGIPRRARRELARIYANRAYRILHNLPDSVDRFITSPQVMGWVVEQYKAVLDAR